MQWLRRLWYGFKETRIMKTFLRLVQFLYIRWRVFLVLYDETDSDTDSLASSSYEHQRRKIIRTNSVYPPSYLFSPRNVNENRHGCIDIYDQFMNYGAMDATKQSNTRRFSDASMPTDTLSSSSNKKRQYFSNNPTEWSCSSSYIHQSEISWDESVSNSNIFAQDFHENTESDVSSFDQWSRTNTVNNWSHTDSVDSIESQVLNMNKKSVLPASSVVENNFPEIQDTFENLQKTATKGCQPYTYPEVQRQVGNYFFTYPRYTEDVSAKPPIFAEKLDVNSYENVYLRQVDEERKKEKSKCVTDRVINCQSVRGSVDAGRNAIPEMRSSSSCSEYHTASVSSPIAKQIAQRFSNIYWNVDDRNGDGAIGAKDNYHNRFFGKSGYFLTRQAIQNLANGMDTMPQVEKRALKKERHAWERVNQHGRTYENVDLPIPDTNGIFTCHWKKEYEVNLKPHTSEDWKTPRRYVPRYTTLF